MVTTNNKELYDRLCLYRTHGITKNPDLLQSSIMVVGIMGCQELGYNYRLTDFQAALGISQLKCADSGLARRQEIAQRYTETFSQLEGSLFTPSCGS